MEGGFEAGIQGGRKSIIIGTGRIAEFATLKTISISMQYKIT